LGFVATNTIAQGDTRATGLQHLVANEGFHIFDAVASISWPGDAAVSVAIVLLAKGRVITACSSPRLGDMDVPIINTQLLARIERSDPVGLSVNIGMSFLGSKIYGQGFVLSPEQRAALIEKNAKNAERIFEYVGGEELNTNPTQCHVRYVISFHQMSLETANQWPDLLQIVRENVKPERDKLREDTGPGKHGKKYWWQYQHPRMPLYEAISKLDRCLVTARVTKHLCFSFQPTGRILNEKIYVFPFPDYTSFALLQSRIHEPWARLLSSTLGSATLNYSASDCFETFPFPRADPRTMMPSLETIGDRLYAERAKYMVQMKQGLTQTYNELKNPACDQPDIVALRRLHEDMDREVLYAYAWTDVAVPPFCPKNADEQRAVEQFREIVVDRLFALNAQRAEEERRLGVANTVKPKRTSSAKGNARKPRSKKSGTTDAQVALVKRTQGENG
jgi:hypothetical protein